MDKDLRFPLVFHGHGTSWGGCKVLYPQAALVAADPLSALQAPQGPRCVSLGRNLSGDGGSIKPPLTSLDGLGRMGGGVP